MKPNADISISIEQGLEAKKPADSTRSYEDAKEAVRTILIWMGEDPTREGLLDTPDRVARAWSEYCQGYKLDPNTLLQTCFSEINGYVDPVCMRDIEFVSHCEHHMAPITGFADVSYVPNGKVVGISKLARVVDCFAKRLQTQERLTASIGKCIDENLQPLGVAVRVKAFHSCMSNRGVNKKSSHLTTTFFTGVFKTEAQFKYDFLNG